MIPQLVMLAGPNGAGMSTYYDVFLADSPLPFLNADLFAAETGVDSFEAARILDATRDRMIEDRLGFITETVFSDPYGEKLAMLRKAIDIGFDVTLIYIGIAPPELSARRVDAHRAWRALCSTRSTRVTLRTFAREAAASDHVRSERGDLR